jgi:hypothetical protein
MPAFGLARSGSLCNELIFICFKKEKKKEEVKNTYFRAVPSMSKARLALTTGI